MDGVVPLTFIAKKFLVKGLTRDWLMQINGDFESVTHVLPRRQASEEGAVL